jgi:ParB/RepB/Spo0J family partition protein
MTASPEVGPVVFEHLALDAIKPATGNRFVHPKSLDDLIESVTDKGVLQPILVRPVGAPRYDGETGDEIVYSPGRAGEVLRFEIVYGERRWRAAREVGLTSIPAMIRALTDAEAWEIRLTENLQRSDLHPLEEAAGYLELSREHGYTALDIAVKVGKSQSYVYARMKLGELSGASRKAFAEGRFTPSTALLVARMPAVVQDKATKRLLSFGDNDELSYRAASDILQREFMLRLVDAPFSTSDPDLVVAAGACTVCPKRTGSQRELFDDVKSADVCTDVGCYRAKVDAHWVAVTEIPSEFGFERALTKAEAKQAISGYGDFMGYVRADAQCHALPWDHPKSGKWGQILKQEIRTKALPLVAARDSEGTFHTLIPEKEARKALKDLGLLKAAEPSSFQAKERKQRQAVGKQKRVARKVLDALVSQVLEPNKAGVSTKKLDERAVVLWRGLAAMANRAVGSRATSKVAERRTGKKDGDPTARGELNTLIEKASPPLASVIVLELLVENEVEEISSYNLGYPSTLVELARAYDIELKDIERKLDSWVTSDPSPTKRSRKK